MVRIVTVNLAQSQELSFEQDTPLQAPTPDVSLEITQLVHMASGLLQHGEIARAQQILLQACALAPLPGQWRGPVRTNDFTAAQGAWKLISTKPAPVKAEAASGALVSEDAHQWPVRILALGGFEILIDGVPFSSGIKPQRRPLDLLKLLVLSDAAPIGAGELADKLWPDSDGDTARNCLQVAVHRLRRLLGHEQAVLVHDRKLHLDRKLCRVDLWEFEAEVARLTELPIGGSDFASRAARALTLYRGHLFSHETDQAWMLAPRERLRRTWLDLVRRLGRHHETRGEWETGSRLYQRAIELDPLAEEIYRRLMLCQHTMGQRNEALCTYRRCRKQLAAVLGVEPSAETERLYRVLCSAAG
jgi:DNA-binding SARP family transcriptional activator